MERKRGEGCANFQRVVQEGRLEEGFWHGMFVALMLILCRLMYRYRLQPSLLLIAVSSLWIMISFHSNLIVGIHGPLIVLHSAMLSTCMMAKNCLPTTLCSVEVLYSAMLNSFTNGSQSQGYSELFIAIQNAHFTCQMQGA